MDLDELYQELILEHSKNRCHRGHIDEPDAETSLLNPLCGDEVEVTLRVANGLVEELKFDGHGCAISQASASMMADVCAGKNVAEVQKLFQQFMMLMKGEAAGDELPDLGDATALEGVHKFSARIKCATLAWEAVNKCLVEIGGSSEKNS